jgi:signal transduction histidine kinase
MGDNDIRVVVDDNGKGFDESIINNRGNMGLRVIKERIEMLGGTFELESIANQGTTITFQVPATEPVSLS